MLVVTSLAAPLLAAPLLVVTVLVAPLPAGPLLPVPVLVDPMAGPSDGESVGLVLAPPVTGELDAGVAGVEEPLPGVDEDAGAWGLAVLGDLAALVVQEGAGVALADVLPVPLVLALAEAAGVAVLTVVALAVPVDGAVAVSPGLVLPPSGPPLVPLSVPLSDGVLTGLAGLSLGVAEVLGLVAFVGLPGADDAEPGVHAGAGTPLWTAVVPPLAPPGAEPAGVPSPFVL
ncbi:MAG TPA: hypothetical protein VFX25_05320 [Streptosporangiaceae bacterium]|nr:hypothetical protein [Streptosporangiaceae bacterium]